MLLNQIFSLQRIASSVANADHRWPFFMGIEFEIENQIGDIPDRAYWLAHRDESLRNGIEYVTAVPMAGAHLEHALDAYYNCEMRYTSGPRTSTHIHLNMTEASVNEVRAMLMIVYTIESGIFSLVGGGRKWASYCSALNEMAPHRLLEIFSPEANRIARGLSPSRHQEKYFGFNCSSLRKHGTMEFRYFTGGISRDKLEFWLDFITSLKRAAIKHANDLQMLAGMLSDATSLKEFLNTEFSTTASELLEVSDLQEMIDDAIAVAAYVVPQPEPARIDTLMFLNPVMLKFTERALRRSPGGLAYLRNTVAGLGVMTEREWRQHIQSIGRTLYDERHSIQPPARETVAVEDSVIGQRWSGLDPFGRTDAESRVDEYSQETLTSAQALRARQRMQDFLRNATFSLTPTEEGNL